MRYKIKDIPSEGQLVQVELGRSLLADALSGLEADLDRSTANARFELSRSGDNVFVRGDLKGLLTLPCSRCLGPALVPLDTPLRVTFTPEDEARESDDPLDDVDHAAHDRHTLDLAPLIRDQLILGAPMTPRCREGCRGLCPVCGENRNELDCGHSANSPFPKG